MTRRSMRGNVSAGRVSSALACGIELGIQPGLFHNAQGAPLYSPYHLSQAIPAASKATITSAGVRPSPSST